METLGIKFWGTRGMVSSPRPTTTEFGGNTTCLQVLYKENIIVVDTGYGVALLGEKLKERIIKGKESLEIHIFFSHFHWDHVLGLSFFHPIYFPNTRLHLYAPVSKQEMWESLNVLFDGSYSPFSGIDSMPSKIEFHQLTSSLSIDGLKVDHIPTEHHIHGNERTYSTVYAYRFRAGSKSIVVATDHEAKQCETNDAFVDFSRSTSLLVHDAQFTDNDVLVGWGHSTVKQALDNAKRIQAKFTLLTHHDPKRNDSEILALDAEYRAKPEYASVSFEFAREGRDYFCK